jgi:uncharacterized protein
MQYSEGSFGRLFIIRIDHDEDLLKTMEDFIRGKNLKSGMILFLGALSEARIVTGPEEAIIPPVPHFESVSGGWEIFGVATVYPGEGGPKIHYHVSVGRGKEAYTGCLREKATAYLVVEAVVMEFLGVQARRELDARTGLILPSFQDSSGQGN